MPGLGFYEQLLEVLEEHRARGKRHVELSRENRDFLFPLPRPARQPDKPPAPAPAAPPTPAAPLTTAPTEIREAPETFRPVAPAPDLNVPLAPLSELVAGCTRCALAGSRTRTVFGEGSATADLMFIGEGPGQEEDRQGRPFVGPAGQLLTRIIKAMQLRREDVYIANIVKCRPPGNRNPQPAEAAACLPYLERQIELTAPRVIVTLGAVPLKHLLQRQGIMRLRGQWLQFRGVAVMPTFHPSYLLRLHEPLRTQAKRQVWQDMQQVMEKLGISPREEPA